jgi:hypothetical protein
MVASVFWILYTALSTTTSPWASSEWRITFNFGRDVDAADSSSKIVKGDSWGESGARLGLSIDVLVESVDYPDSQAERDFIGGSGASNVLSVLEDASYITMAKGQQTVRFGPTGAWKLSTRRTGRPGDASVLRFWLDVVDDAVRNDVSLKAGERLYATSNCWRETDFEIGRKRLAPFLKRLDETQRIITARLDHKDGDRRLDGTDIVDTAMGSIDMAILVNQRDELLSELRSAQLKLPGMTDVSSLGHWPGSTENLVISEGKVGVKRRKGFWEEFQIVGTWMATPLGVVAGTYDDTSETSIANSL